MTDTKVNIEYNNTFEYDFNLPTGIVVVGSNVFVVDNQNHKVKKFDLSFNFVSVATSLLYT